MKTFFKTLTFICLCLLSNALFAQVGINIESPYELTELHIMNRTTGTGSSIDTIPKGILIPRMSEKKRNQMNIDNPNLADGLFIYNTTEDCYNYYSKMDKEWKSLCGKLGNAVFSPVNCADITAQGTYVVKQDMDESNYLEIKVNVTKTGNYNITGITGNGYYFTGAGTVLELGEKILRIPATGSPRQIQQDKITITGIPLADVNCKPQLTVNPMFAQYTINCDRTVVNGEYSKNTALNGNNTIDLYVNVSAVGFYSITSEDVNGISFKTTGEFSSLGMQKVTLMGTGTPSVNTAFDITITANTKSGSSTCDVTIPIILPPMTYAVIGPDGVYGWANALGVANLRKLALANSANFSSTGTVRIKSLTNLWETNNGTTASEYLNSGYGGIYPDILIFYAYGVNYPQAASQAIANYISRGGCVIYAPADTDAPSANSLISSIFGTQYATAQAQVYGEEKSDNNYLVASLPDSKAINGPFGNCSGQHWGENGASSQSIIFTSLPPQSTQVCSAYNPYGKTEIDPAYSIVWYNNSYNFYYFGDSVGSGNSPNSTTDYPAYYSGTGIPLTKLHGPSDGNYRYVYNSIMEMNAVSWALNKAATSGINPH